MQVNVKRVQPDNILDHDGAIGPNRGNEGKKGSHHDLLH